MIILIKKIIPTNYEFLQQQTYDTKEWDYQINLELIKNFYSNRIDCKIKKENKFDNLIKNYYENQSNTYYYKQNFNYLLSKKIKLYFLRVILEEKYNYIKFKMFPIT